jgi:apolipoprotein N-acyltransferase
MLRATNTGMTAIIDAHGQIVSQLPAFTTGVLQGKVQAYSGMTPYGRFGNGPALALIFLAGLLGLAGTRQRTA